MPWASCQVPGVRSLSCLIQRRDPVDVPIPPILQRLLLRAGKSYFSFSAFLHRLMLASPIRLIKLLTDNVRNSPTAPQQKTGSPVASMPSIKSAPPWVSNTAWHRPGIRKRMAWSNVSTAVSATYCSSPDSTAGSIWRRACSTI